MELGSRLGKKITTERQEALAEHTASVEIKDAAREARERKQAEKERLNRPFALVSMLMKHRGRTTFNPTVAGEREIEVGERFRLRPTTIEMDRVEKTASLDLIIKTKLRPANPGYGDIPGPFSLSLAVSVPGEPETTHYLTSISKPLVRQNDMPENYGMRVYKQDGYEVQSWVPSEADALVFIAAIEEAAEIEGIAMPIADAGTLVRS